MRAADDLPRRERGWFRGRGRVVAIVAVLGLFLLAASLQGIAGFYTDYLWFDALDRADVWRQVLGAKIVLTLIFGGVFFGLLWLNLFIADRNAPTFRPAGPEEELLARYHEVVAGRAGIIRIGVAALFTLVAAAGVPSNWEEWLLFTNRQDFGITDPQFDTDYGFYVFQLPFLSFVVGWAFAAFVIILILTAVSHYLNGSIRVTGTAGSRATPTVKVHLSAILAVLAVIKTVDYWLDRYELTVSERGVVDGALHTDVNAQLPAIYLLMAISASAVVLLLINLRRRGWTMPVLAVGLWAFTAVVVGGIYPAFIQRFQVQPNETTLEAPFVDRNIEATRYGFALTDVDKKQFNYSENLSPEQLRDNADTVRNARLIDPIAVHPTFEREQTERDFYRFIGLGGSLDTDRYMIDGELRQVIVGARELQLDSSLSWERSRVRLTHGYGLAMATANTAVNGGSPDFVASGLPTAINDAVDASIETPQIYHGEDFGGYALVNATVDELDYVSSQTGTDVNFRYDGKGGVEMGSFLRKMAFALRFREIDPLITNFVTDETRVIYNRDVHNRVEELAPFLELDADTYPVLVDGRIQYVIDAFTTTNRLPYSQRSDLSGVRGGGLSGESFNYVRNSVKAVVDAYDGTVALYVMPGDDPIIDAWQAAFPELFTDFEEMPEELREHLRYPQDLFRVQTNMYATYQVEQASTLIIGSETWAVAQDPGRTVTAGGTAEDSVDEFGVVTTREQRVPPYYTLLTLPGEEEPSFVTLRSFVPVAEDDGRRELEAFMIAETTADGLSRLVSYEMDSADAPGPVLVATSIAQNDEIAQLLSLLNSTGSRVEFGDLLLLPIDDTILWVRGLYVAAEGTPVPTLERVIVSVGDSEQLAIGDDFSDALSKLFPGRDENFDDILADPVTRPRAVVDAPDPEAPEDDPDPDPAAPDPTVPDPDPTDADPTGPAGLPDSLEATVVAIDDAWQEADAALAANPPDRVGWAAALDRIDELLAHSRTFIDPDPPEPVDPGEVES